MKLYHIHLLNNHDELYYPDSTIYIDKDTFNNGLYKRIYNMNPGVNVNKYKEIVEELNRCFIAIGFQPVEKRVNLGEVIEYALVNGCSNEEIIQILKDAKKIALDERINLREMALEEYRKENTPELPSRLHSLFACTEEGLKYWNKVLLAGHKKGEVYSIEVDDNTFVSNEQLLPEEELFYGDKVKEAHRYFKPSKELLNPRTNEYLVQGEVKLKRVY